MTNWAYWELLINKQPLKAKALFKFMAYLYPNNSDWKEGMAAADKALKLTGKSPNLN
ncbi:hypothetical protein EV200_102440 [Pedobacter psychrotolerans]|uniref:Tetratricopeptide repeat protein n=1 Tax=Pedobacter psychrotolerans TaxID=1843235 RepID=A0A4R2HIC3_9SPHI|nr:hypothetical protein [Pedobacter psychrotolerans]TCO29021.1 hypothetical protein EV200_102440 [Pedobacter psychrotolerans]GGE53510.1 hypothetical protein GCM10011413_19870 [Pedobacter psychrotolerans]